MNKFDLDSFKVGADIRNGCWSKVYIKGDLVLKEYKSEEEVRKETKRDLAEGFLAELNSLKSLRDQSNFPKLIDYDENKKWILMSRHGLPLSSDNKIPKSIFKEQMAEIIEILTKEKINHGDISRNNLLWDGKQLVLIDFNESTIQEKPRNKLHRSCYRFFERNIDISTKAIQLITEKCKQRKGFGGYKLYQSLLDREGNLEEGFLYRRNLRSRWRNYQIPRECLVGKKVLDIGCNMGGFSIFCLQSSCKSYLGIDEDLTPIEIAKEIYQEPNLIFRHQDFGSFLESNEDNFDTIFSFAVHKYICKECNLTLSQYLEKLLSILNKKGSIHLETHPHEDIDDSLSNFKVVTKKIFDRSRYYYHLRVQDQ